MTIKQERGAIMLEVLAVLALIGVMGPMLYKQVLSRNQEISNVNIAAEMRAIKEAMSAAIAADGAIFAELCGASAEAFLTECTNGTDALQYKVVEFLPVGMERIMEPAYGYKVKLYSYEVQLANGEIYPIVVGVVGGTDLASDWTFKRAARVANLIGTDGGIVHGTNLVGAGGSWKLDNLNLDKAWEKEFDYCESFKDGCPIVVATTALDTFDPDLGATDPNAVAVPQSLAFSDLHAWNYFSVGDKKGPTDPDRCFELQRTLDDDGKVDTESKKGVPDKIYGAGGGDGDCDPLFWVGAKETDTGDNSTAGHVYVKKNLYVGRDNTGKKQAFAFETQGTNAKDKDDNEYVVPNNRFVVYDGDGYAKFEINDERFVVYDISGNTKLIINDKGQIVTEDTIRVKDAKTTTDGGVAKEVEDLTYGLDPANTSVLNDVRLASRGGARLSDILPNYISKGMYQLSSTTTASNQSWSTEIKKPTCPDGYAAAVIVTPLKWGASAVQEIVVPKNTKHDLSVSNNKVTGTINEITVPKANITQYALAIEIDGGEKDMVDNRTTSTSETPWTVKIGYKDNENNWNGSLKSGEIQALAQTYCVYTGTPDIPDDKLIKE